MFQQGAFLIDANQTPEQIARKRLAIAAMMPRFGSARNVGEGLGQLGTGILMGIGDYQANRDEAAGRAQGDSVFNAFLERMGGSNQPEMGAAPSAQPSVSGSVPVAAQNNDPVSARVAEGWSPFAPQQNNAYADAIASIESAGSGNYSAVGPTHSKLGRALGRYQVMEANVGPWSKEALGREVTADEFLANPQIQDQVFNNRFGRYVDQYGPEGAAQAWFAGPGGVGKLDRQDSLGTSVAAYTDKFRSALGNQTASAAPMAPSGISSDPTADLAMALRARQENAGQTAINGAMQAPAPQMMAQAAPVQPAMPQMQQPQAQTPPMSLQELYQLSANPFLSDQQRGIVNMMLQQQIQANDPLRQMQLERGRLELAQMRNPQASVPDSVRALQIRAAEAGLAPGSKEYADFMISGGNKGITVDARQMGTIPPGFQVEYDPDGRPTRMVPIPGSPAAAEAEAVKRQQANLEAGRQSRGSLLTQEIDRALNVIDDAKLPATGVGSTLSVIPGTSAKQLAGLLDTIKANIGFAELNRMRAESPTGGALGAVTERELAYLQSVAGSLDQSQDAQTLRDNMNRLWNTYQDVIHGENNGPTRRRLSFEKGADQSQPPAGVDKAVWDVMTDEERALWRN